MSSNVIRDLNQIYLNEVSADKALEASKKADVERGKAAASGDKEKAAAKAQQASRLYKASAEKRKKEPVAIADRSYPKGKGANYKEDKDWGYDKKGNSLNPVDIEKRKKKEDDLAGSPKNEELQQIRSLVEKEVKVKDTRRVVDAIRAYDKSKDASRDATYDTDEGDKEKAEIEKKYAAKERGEIDKDDPNWKKRKYHTGIHGEEVEALKRLVESGKFSDEEIESMAWDVYEGLVEPAGTSDAAVDKATRKAATRKFGNTTPPKAKIPEGYQRNPEKGEEEERKAEKRRKESGRMPPRGDKRREDFEKWYAANVR